MNSSRPSPPASGSPEPVLDPVYRNARREAVVIIFIYTVFLIWTISYCGTHAYLDPGEEILRVETVLGMPSWVVWGIAAPWFLANLATFWFCFFFMADDDLGEIPEEQEQSHG